MFQGQRYRRRQKEAQKGKTELRKRFTVKQKEKPGGFYDRLYTYLFVGFNAYCLDEMKGVFMHHVEMKQDKQWPCYIGNEDRLMRIPLYRKPWFEVKIWGDWTQPEMHRFMEDMDYVTDSYPAKALTTIQRWEVGRTRNPTLDALSYDEPPRIMMEDINRWNVVLAPTRFVINGPLV